MYSLYLLILVIIHWPWGCNSLWTVSKSTAKTGTNITIPCHYHRMFKANFKYWCKGRSWALCTVVASTDPKRRRGGVSITDNPEELVFTVTMLNLTETDTNRYWCALKVGGIGKPDVRVSLELKITKASPDLSVVDGMVSGEEGSSVSVQCLYSDPLRDRAKYWCRSGDRHSCQTQTETTQNASVVIRDGKNGVLNVMFRKLERKDAGWYWCSVGDLQSPVQLSVTQRSTMHGNSSAVTTPRMLHSSFPSFEPTTSSSTLIRISPPSTVVSAQTSTSSYASSNPYPAVSIKNITIHSSIPAPLSTTVQPKLCPSTESITTVNHQIYYYRNIHWHVAILIVLALVLLVMFVLAAVNFWRTYSKNFTRSIEGEMAELVINQNEL